MASAARMQARPSISGILMSETTTPGQSRPILIERLRWRFQRRTPLYRSSNSSACLPASRICGSSSTRMTWFTSAHAAGLSSTPHRSRSMVKQAPPPSRFAADEPPAHVLHHARRERKTKPQPFADLLGGEERIEEILSYGQDRCRSPDRRPGALPGHPLTSCADRQGFGILGLRPPFHRIDPILDKIAEHLLQAHRLGEQHCAFPPS